MSDEDGREVVRKPITMDSFYAGTETRIEVPLDARLPVGRYSVAVALSDAERGLEASAPALGLTVEAEAEPPPPPAAGVRVPSAISALLGEDEQTIPWPVVIGLPVAVLLLIAAYAYRRSRRPVGRHFAGGD